MSSLRRRRERSWTRLVTLCVTLSATLPGRPARAQQAVPPLPPPVTLPSPPPGKPAKSAQAKTGKAAKVEQVPFRMEEQKTAYLLSGIAKRQQGDYQGAVEDLRIYVSGNDRDSDGHFELALAYAMLHELKPQPALRGRAIEHFRLCYDLSPAYQRSLPTAAKPGVAALAAKGRELAGVTGDAPGARSVDAVGMLQLAESQVDAGDFMAAKRSYDDVRALPPPPEAADRERVRAKIEKAFRERLLKIQSLEYSDITSAQSEMSTLLRYFPDEPVALETYVRLQGRYSKTAMDDVAGAKVYQTFKNSIEGFALKGQLKDALSDVNRMLFNFPRDPYAERKYQDIMEKNSVAMREAVATFEAQRYEEARKLFEQLRRDYPDPGTAQDAISEIDEVRRKLEADLDREQERGNYAAMHPIAKEFAAKFPSHPRPKEALKLTLGQVDRLVGSAESALGEGRLYEAVGDFEKALAIVPGQAAAEAGLVKARTAMMEARKTLWNGLQNIPAGRFVLGASSPPEARPKDKNANLPAFFLDKTKVSNQHYRQFALATGQKAPAGWKGPDLDPSKADLPVSGVSYAEAEAYCRWLGKRLPTELEWEKAARGPEGLDLPYENAPSKTRKMFNPFQEYPVAQWPELASPYGILGMTGPVWEWTSSWFKAYPGNDEKSVLSIPANTFRVLRGGTKSPTSPSDGKPLDAAFRERRTPERRDPDLGFRCAASSDAPPALLTEDRTPEKIPPPEADAAPKPPART